MVCFLELSNVSMWLLLADKIKLISMAEVEGSSVLPQEAAQVGLLMHHHAGHCSKTDVKD